MKPYYILEYFQELCNKWTRHDNTNYKSLQSAEKVLKSYKEHQLGIKLRILKIEKIK